MSKFRTSSKVILVRSFSEGKLEKELQKRVDYQRVGSVDSKDSDKSMRLRNSNETFVHNLSTSQRRREADKFFEFDLRQLFLVQETDWNVFLRKNNGKFKNNGRKENVLRKRERTVVVFKVIVNFDWRRSTK